MNKKDYLDAISKQRRIQKTLNDIYIWSKFALFSLEAIEGEREMIESIPGFAVPSVSIQKKVKRNVDDVISIINKARSSELYKALIVYVVSLVEPVLLEIVKLTLLYDKRRLKLKPKGSDKHLDYDTIVDCNNYNDVLNIIISKHVETLAYSTPKEQMEYLEKLLSIEIDNNTWDEWIEIKASRDLIVHNSCIINKVYLEKTGDNARGEIDDELQIDEIYFNNTIVVGKRLVGKIVSKILRKEK